MNKLRILFNFLCVFILILLWTMLQTISFVLTVVLWWTVPALFTYTMMGGDHCCLLSDDSNMCFMIIDSITMSFFVLGLALTLGYANKISKEYKMLRDGLGMMGFLPFPSETSAHAHDQ